MKLSYAVGATERMNSGQTILASLSFQNIRNFCQTSISQQLTIAPILFLPLFCVAVSSYVRRETGVFLTAVKQSIQTANKK